jgi:hypothetical protein
LVLAPTTPGKLGFQQFAQLAPQAFTSLEQVLAHTPLAEHPVVHCPFWHVAVVSMLDTHFWPHAPQAAPSCVRSWQAPLQFVFGKVHAGTQLPESHTSPVAQKWPQAPQLVAAPRSASQPSLASPSQSAKPGWHEAMAQAPAGQMSVSTAGPSWHGAAMAGLVGSVVAQP